ncbi:MAG: SMP-30/gluconolactonase/LRE family protein [Anaerolineales bacterium]
MAESRPSTRARLRAYMPFLVLIVAAVAICMVSAALIVRSFQGERREPFIGDVPGTTVSTLVELPGDRAFPESITLGPGDFLYSGSFCTGEIWRIDPQAGTLETWLAADAGIEAVSGMAFSPEGWLYVADRGSCDPRAGVSSLKRVSPEGVVEEWGEVTDDEIINSLAFDARGTLYATDTQLGQIRSYDDDGAFNIWWEVPADPNTARPTGLAYDTARDALVVADSGNGIIYRIGIDARGQAGEIAVLYEDDRRELDGLTLDDTGRVIFTSYDNARVMRLTETGAALILAQNFREPSDVAFLDDRVYVTNFDSISLAPLIGWVLDPSLPFTIDVIDLSRTEDNPAP